MLKLGAHACFFTAAICALVTTALAEEKSIIESEPDPTLQAAMNNWHYEMVQCLAYYMISQEGSQRAERPDIVEATQLVIDELMMRTYLLHRPETTIARLEIEMQAQTKEMHDDYSNFSILLAKYAAPCKEVVEKSEDRLDYWIWKEMQE